MRAALRTIAERLLLGAVAGAATLLVLAWAGTRWRTSTIAGAVTGVLVVAASWVAATLPGPVTDESNGPRARPRPGESGRD